MLCAFTPHTPRKKQTEDLGRHQSGAAKVALDPAARDSSVQGNIGVVLISMSLTDPSNLPRAEDIDIEDMQLDKNVMGLDYSRLTEIFDKFFTKLVFGSIYESRSQKNTPRLTFTICQLHSQDIDYVKRILVKALTHRRI